MKNIKTIGQWQMLKEECRPGVTPPIVATVAFGVFSVMIAGLAAFLAWQHLPRHLPQVEIAAGIFVGLTGISGLATWGAHKERKRREAQLTSSTLYALILKDSIFQRLTDQEVDDLAKHIKGLDQVEEGIISIYLPDKLALLPPKIAKAIYDKLPAEKKAEVKETLIGAISGLNQTFTMEELGEALKPFGVEQGNILGLLMAMEAVVGKDQETFKRVYQRFLRLLEPIDFNSNN